MIMNKNYENENSKSAKRELTSGQSIAKENNKGKVCIDSGYEFWMGKYYVFQKD
ncbi:hypothetical protein ABH966_005191 [Lysinibacillus sp. RC46]|uniref:hypothetical protein n=1 Tax=Lysinibacillus sp. RC46 TaxID=3156295 RepID=UPI003512CEA8